MKYRLNDDVGGEWDAVAVHGDKVGFDFPGVEDRVWLPIDLLSEIEPPLPPEPPNGTVVRVGPEAVYMRHDPRLPDDPYRYLRMGADGYWAWKHICSLGVPVLYIPDPFAEPVNLPWSSVGRAGTNGIGVMDSESGAVRVVIGKEYIYLDPAEARDMARALWHAATRAEAVHRAADGTAAP